ncbi:MAG: bifunctional diaminohydroxyphosphoribosylaminopyrimidine deaminase/5-amino-6-(5-phosphoribosylamino)uracil reductase RibD [Zoogloeaceae bacterium]|jgi:diaminohydroxyphosphoribosylaminopyrimidine deaminase/5-amino-6-(5-phosphoribosylamino)uracil reductase|nr:bifunctional diaminohydroxyphosphoribosylaminopyrimidine deaminase/5-amino-6-(5-phosphoribosylamino)uracil reductase RibD [Zoogloeaceae bacterium]
MPECFSSTDRAFMAEALSLAEQGLLTTTPNPRVGCVLVKEGVVVGRGWHARAGEAHAEIHALAAAGEAARGATAYVTLEPCSHYGRTPPCAEALQQAGVARVIAAMTDPNPQVAGSGLARLCAAGIRVDSGLLEAEARELNLGFISRMTRGRPWVRLKSAASLDGKTALSTGESQWITGAAARQDGHRFRARACALLTGMGTVRHDDPRLSVREVATPRQPWRVVVDSRLELAPSARLLADGVPVLVVFAQDAPARRAALTASGAECLCLPDADGRVDLAALLTELGRRGVNELHVEAGSRLNGALLQAGLADELLLYFAPCLLGDAAQGLFALPQPQTLAARLDFRFHEVTPVGEDIRLRLRRQCRG